MSISVPIQKQIETVKGSPDNRCDFCQQENKDGFSGETKISVEKPVFESKLVIEDWYHRKVYSIFGKGEVEKIIKGDVCYQNIILDYKTEVKTIEPIVCNDCVRAMYKSLK